MVTLSIATSFLVGFLTAVGILVALFQVYFAQPE